MTISLSDLSYVKPKTITDSNLNGGRMGTATVISGARHSLFPRVTKTERTNGVTRHRKQFWKNENAENLSAWDLLQWIEVPSNAGDIFYLKAGTDTDTQGDLTSPAAGVVPLWMGAGRLKTALSGGETSLTLTMKTNNFVFPNGGYLHLADKVATSQTVAVGVVVGDSVNYSGSTWNKITSTPDITYPKGVYLGTNSVLTLKDTTNEEWLSIAENLYTDESIGTGTGAATPTLTNPLHRAKGICQVPDRLPVVKTLTVGDAVLTAYIRQDGTVDTVLGDASAGTLNMTTGIWTTPITWKTNPGTGKDITITYREKAYSYAGNDCTVDLSDQVANAYAIANTIGSACVYNAEVKASFDSMVFTGASDGAFNSTALTVHNAGAVRDSITLTFTSASAYSVVGTNLGALGAGTIGTAPVIKNPESNKNMFTISNSGWSGNLLTGDTLRFELYPSAQAVWVREVVPPGTLQEPHNLCVLGYYLE